VESDALNFFLPLRRLEPDGRKDPSRETLRGRRSRRSRSGGRDGAVVVAVITVRMVEPSVHEVVDVVAVRHGFVPACGAVGMAGRVGRCRPGVAVGMLGVHSEHVLVDVVLVWVM
jgi:hypothetical protein